MSLQDKIFDVEHELMAMNAPKHVHDDFDDIITYIGDLERELDTYRNFYHSLVELRRSIAEIDKKKQINSL